jgi:5-phospho-D-xylono-1,4-lactonase
MTGSTAVARTILGDLPAHELGADSHDHLFLASPMLRGHELDDAAAALAEVTQFAAAGGRTIAQWTPRGLGRRRQDLARISRASGITILSATGRHRAEHYPHAAAVESVEDLSNAFVGDIEDKELPCGFIKVGTSFHHLDTFESNTLAAAAHAQRATGAPIAVHLELGTSGDLFLGCLFGLGVAAASVILGHVGRSPDRH